MGESAWQEGPADSRRWLRLTEGAAATSIRSIFGQDSVRRSRWTLYCGGEIGELIRRVFGGPAHADAFLNRAVVVDLVGEQLLRLFKSVDLPGD